VTIHNVAFSMTKCAVIWSVLEVPLTTSTHTTILLLALTKYGIQ